MLSFGGEHLPGDGSDLLSAESAFAADDCFHPAMPPDRTIGLATKRFRGSADARDPFAAIWIVRGSPAARSPSLDPSAGTGVAPAG